MQAGFESAKSRYTVTGVLTESSGGGIKNKSIEEKAAAMASDAKDSVQKNLAEAKDKVQETAQKITK